MPRIKERNCRRMSAARRDNRLWASRMKDNHLLAARMKNNRLFAARMKENRLLAARMANIKSTVDHRNENRCRSMLRSNAGKRKQDLVVISEENQALYQRLLSRKSVYSRDSMLGDWIKTEYLMAHLARYPREQAAKQRLERKEKKVTFDKQDQGKATTGRSKEIPRDQSIAGKRKQDLVAIGGKNQAVHPGFVPRKSVYSRERFLAEWKKMEPLRQHLARFPREQTPKQRLERKERKMSFDKQDQSSSKATTGRSKEIPRDHLSTGKKKQDLVIGGKNQGMYQRRLAVQSSYSRERFLTEWMKMEPLRQHMTRFPKKQAPKQPIYQKRLPHKSEFAREHWLKEWKKMVAVRNHLDRYPRQPATKQKPQRKEKMVTVDKQDQPSSKATTGRSKKLPGSK
ncbi:uncharacterized protein si:ch211-284k5.2 isoform X2 [Poeciliopsis prolifica]|uniref:uncharacterized protein si:ch211-284k5.2 isoform X2 n=1 Tax=Poeciliopsis prolifica TaxID=188132 RepID=UPI002413932B|nr:uncharacterized protein si:ch211-284k5.2 isoform X2 [Poeciliopsis prolifica]